MKLSKQFLLLAGIGLLDLVSTIWLVHKHGAAEANPLMARFLAYGFGAFVLAKLAFLVLPLVTLEWARHRRPRFTHRAMNAAIAGYLFLYPAGVARANAPIDVNMALPDDPERVAAWATLEHRIQEKRRLGLVPALHGSYAPAVSEVSALTPVPTVEATDATAPASHL